MDQMTASDIDLASVKDRLEIMELAARYNDAAREFDAERYADCFAEDGVYRHLPGGPWTAGIESCGRQALIDMVHAQKKAGGDIPRGMQHITTDFQIVLAGDEATSKCQLIIYGRFAAGEPNRVEACGVYHDKLVRTAAGWRFAERESTLWHADD